MDGGRQRQGPVTVCGSMVDTSLHEHGRRCEHRTLQDTDSMRSDAGPVHDEVTEDDDMDFVAAPAWALARHVQVALPPSGLQLWPSGLVSLSRWLCVPSVGDDAQRLLLPNPKGSFSLTAQG